tara:strand:- start:1061 stop:2152 length:1092 start_codon:yes stop_codon:yes gene_type:complete
MLLIILSSPVSMHVQAADSCAGDTSPVRWNETAQRLSLVPFYDGSWWGGFDDYGDAEYYEDDKQREDNTESQAEPDVSLNPEEPWMYQTWMLPRLEPLEENHYTTMLIGNDSVGTLRVNLSADYRTTVCITLQDTNLNPVNGDVYLLTTEEYNSYTQSYHSHHDDGYYGYGEIEESLSNIPPEWRSFNFLGWKSYRDSHEYEQTSEVNFALNLDGPEIYSSFFTGTTWEDFYIVIDTWDNIHDSDEESPNTIVAADITIITTERSFILPAYTVSLVFLVVLLGTLAIPFILNAKYMKAGLVAEVPQNIVPSLETPAEYPHPSPMGAPPKAIVELPPIVESQSPTPQPVWNEAEIPAASESEML